MYEAFTEYTGTIYAVERPPQGCNFDVTQIIAERGKFIVKTGDASWKIGELEKEANVLTALATYLPLVPSYLARDTTCFLFTYVEGMNLVKASHLLKENQHFTPASDYPAIATEYGKGLRRIHDNFHPEFPCLINWLGEAREQCSRNVADGIVSGTVDEHSIHHGRPVTDLLDVIVAERPRYRNEIRFSHGDWCMPNVLVENGAFVGAIDWSNGGYKDYRYDLATGLWSLRRNGLAGFEADYLMGYGYPDTMESLAFFEALYALL
jgi:aminoglycoside phosphotransferase